MNVPSGSMIPTMMEKDHILFNRLAYVFQSVERGDIVVFKFDNDSSRKDIGSYYVKRVIGLPGDTVSFENGVVFINNQPYYEEYLPEQGMTYSNDTFEVPEDSYFVLGDNRSNSYDARYWENPYITSEQIQGKVLCVLPWHLFRK